MQAPNTTEFLNDENDDSVPEEKKSVNEGSSNQVDDDDDQRSSENAPLLFVDVNLGPNDQRRIVVYEGDSASELARKFCEENELDDNTFEKLDQLLS